MTKKSRMGQQNIIDYDGSEGAMFVTHATPGKTSYNPHEWSTCAQL